MAGKKLEQWQKRIRAHIKAHELSPEVIAEKVGTESTSTVRHWLNGTRRIKLDQFLSLCRAVGIDPAFALSGGLVMHEEHVTALRAITSSLPSLSGPQKRLPPPKRRGDGEDDTIPR